MPQQRRHPFRTSLATFCGLLSVLLILAAPAGHAQSPPGSDISPAPSSTASPLDLLTTIADQTTPQAAKDLAADRLIAQADRPDVVELIRIHLAASASTAQPCLTLFRAVARSSSPPAPLFGPFADFASRTTPDNLPPLLPSFASWRTRDSLQLLRRFTDPAYPSTVRTAAFESLARLTGRDDLGPDASRWSTFVDRAAALPEGQWNAELIASLAAHADALIQHEATALARTSDALRKLYLATPPEQRSDLLAALLLDELDQARDLGFELASRELSSTHRLEAPVAQACLKLVKSDSPRVRQHAAALLLQLSPPDAGPAITAALEKESDPDAAAALLAASVRWPSPSLIRPVIHWLTQSPQARVAASDAALALTRAGLIQDPAARAQILDTLRATEPNNLPPAAGPLLVLLGDDQDRITAAGLLLSPNPAVRAATADALVVHPDHLDSLVDAARADPQLWDPCVRCLTMHRATAASFLTLATIASPTPEARHDGLQFLASVMPASEILAAAQKLRADDPTRDLLLTSLTDRARSMSLTPGSLEMRSTVEGLLLLTQDRLSRHQPDAALLALDALPKDPPELLAIARFRTLTLLALNRIDQAASLDGTADDWLDGLESVSAEPHAPAVVDGLTQKFAALSQAQQTRLDALKAKIEHAAASPAPARKGPPD